MISQQENAEGLHSTLSWNKHLQREQQNGNNGSGDLLHPSRKKYWNAAILIISGMMDLMDFIRCFMEMALGLQNS